MLLPILSVFDTLNFLVFVQTIWRFIIRAPIAPAPHTFRSYLERTQSNTWPI